MGPLIRLRPGEIFAHDFRIVAPLSQGGMGSVYVVDQLSTGAQRALKLMLPELVADEKLRQRFEQEARIGARIESDHVVQVVAAGLDAATGTPWLAMELLRGMTLAAYIAEHHAASPALLVAVFQQLCHAIAAAHAGGIVHRDLKPENIFLAGGRWSNLPFMVKVLDFGIAKIAAEAKTTKTAAIGTPAWLAPEQASSGQPIGPQTDVWALGLIAFWMLTGRSYWRAANDESSTVAMLMREMFVDDIGPASVRALELGVRIEPAFDGWFARCVRREIGARFANASDAYAELVAVFASYADPQKNVVEVSIVPTPKTVPMVISDVEHDPSRGRTEFVGVKAGADKKDFTSKKATRRSVLMASGKSKWRTIATLLVLVGTIATLLALVGLVLPVPRSWRLKAAKRSDSANAVVGEPSARMLPPAAALGAYSWAPRVGSYPQPDGHYLTLVRFAKTDGPWNAQESKFELWFDGEVDPEFDSRGFESPVTFDVQVPEPRHFSITVSTAPLKAANYIAFSFKSAKAVALVRSDVSPRLAGDGGR